MGIAFLIEASDKDDVQTLSIPDLIPARCKLLYQNRLQNRLDLFISRGTVLFP